MADLLTLSFFLSLICGYVRLVTCDSESEEVLPSIYADSLRVAQSYSSGEMAANDFRRVHLDRNYKLDSPKGTKLKKCVTTRLDSAMDCLMRFKPSFSHWKRNSQVYNKNLVGTFLNESGASPLSVLDFGSGRGDYLREFFERGVPILVGVKLAFTGHLAFYSDGWNYEIGPIQFPFTLPQNLPLFEKLKMHVFGETSRHWDVVWSFEVLEHIPRNEHCNVLNFLSTEARNWLVTSVAHIGQKGIDHVANRDPQDIIEDNERRGLSQDHFVTSRVRQTSIVRWGRENLLVFKTTGIKNSMDCTKDSTFKPYED